jgi:hypothetical protein
MLYVLVTSVPSSIPYSKKATYSADRHVALLGQVALQHPRVGPELEGVLLLLVGRGDEDRLARADRGKRMEGLNVAADAGHASCEQASEDERTQPA